MRFVIQRVTESEVKVDGEVLGKIGRGFMVLIGVSDSDTKEIADKMVKKMLGLRIFEDEQGKTNLSLETVGGELLLISQFTLYANCKKGNRPSFIEAGAPDMAEEMYEYIISKCKEQVPVVERGRFGADMKVSLINDGPFTIVLDSDKL
ncbi:D-aminoacyl-tRNA deacylase [Faecalicatena contorta]|uniref:D-aminoacyl-tRNA deacylase n=1 Tax=Faecalicatena contorta TaxID=39482 RepID=UPI001F1BB0DC|nr:D-aminoacyl-tRNA deacylase [Faecalicatena contorta]MCF2684019.1 D-tyrosyl-tRNA(Tyr) deacylase [Faecalicatena contorta]